MFSFIIPVMGKLNFQYHYIIILENIIFSLLRIVVISVMDLFVLSSSNSA